MPISSTKVSITSQIGVGRGAVRPGFERGRLVIANVAVQECRLGEFGGGKTCRHEKAKVSWASSLLSRVIRSRALDAGRVAVEDAIRRTTRAPGAYLRTLAYARISFALPPSARDDHASRPAAYVSR